MSTKRDEKRLALINYVIYMNKDIASAVGRNHNIDILKAICAIEVVVLHMPFVVKIDPRFAVPCFFMVSGFFLYSPDQDKRSEKLVRAIKHIAILILWSSAVYFTYWLGSYLCGASDFPQLFTLKEAVKTIVLNENLFAYHLWYLNAYLYVLAITYFLNKRGWLHVLFWAIPLCLLFTLIFGRYSVLVLGRKLPLMLSRNFIGLGIPCFAIGIWAKQHFAMLQSCRWLVKGAPWFVVLAVLVWPVERYILRYFDLSANGLVFISSLLMALSLFFAFILRNCQSENWLSKMGRDDSLYLYIFHILVAWLLVGVLEHFELNTLLHIYNQIGPLVIIPLTLLLIHLSRYAWRLCCKAK